MPVLALNRPETVEIIDKMIEVFDGQTGFSNFETRVESERRGFEKTVKKIADFYS